MSTSSNDPNAPDPKPELDSTEQPLPEKQTLAGKAMPYLAALAAAGAAQAGAAVPAAEQDRAYLEALLHGSWTQPADLSERRLPPGTQAEPVQLAGELDAAADPGFNDSYNPNPKPYSDTHYADSGFGDRSN